MTYILKAVFSQNSTLPRWVIFFIDVSICAISFVVATFLRFNFFIEDPLDMAYFYALPFVIAIRVMFILYFRIYAGIIRHTSIQDAARVFYTVTLSTLLIGLANIVYTKMHDDEKVLIPVSIIIIDYLGTTLMMNFFRLATKLLYMRATKPAEAAITNFAIFGAGEAGMIVKRKLEQYANGKRRVVVFFDDDPKKITNYVDNVTIYNGMTDLEEKLRKLNIKELIISSQLISKARKHEIIEACLNCDVNVRTVPPSDRWINGELSFNQIRGIKIDDLIERDEIVLDKGAISQKLFNKTILITGAAGSIGSEIARQILSNFNPKKLILVDKSEVSLYDLDAEFSTHYKHVYSQSVQILVGDITNAARMRSIFKSFKPDIVFHAAAYKHVPLMEVNACEAVRVNVGGTRIIADLAVEFNADKFVFVSTDKAVNPTNVMGASKRIAEIYVQSLDHSLLTKPDARTRFITTRFGNVLGSSGSVIPKFRKQIEEGGPVTVTHPDVTRYFMTIPEACQLVLEAGNMGNGGEIYIFDMGKSMKIIDLARRMIQLSGLKLGEDIQIVFSGLRPGEKLKEELLADQENTIPTYHPKILIAKVRLYDLEWARTEISDLLNLYESQNNEKLVQKMKEIVPEFVSQNSVFEMLDFKTSVKSEAEKHSRII